MGNSNSVGTQPLAMMAVARKLKLQRFQIIMMRECLKSFSDNYGFVDRASFDESLTRSKIVESEALEIFDLLFTMWDHHHVNVIPAKKFAVGISPLACSSDDISSILRFALHMHDESNVGKISEKDLHDVLISIDNTASYFGDVHLEPGDIDSVVEAVFDGVHGLIARELCVRKLQSNAYIKRFVSGKTRIRVQFKVDMMDTGLAALPPLGLEVVEEALTPLGLEVAEDALATLALDDSSDENVPQISSLVVHVPQTPIVDDKESLLTFDDENSENRAMYSPIKAIRSSSGLESWASFLTEDTVSTVKDPPSTVFVLQDQENKMNSPFARGTRDPPAFFQ